MDTTPDSDLWDEQEWIGVEDVTYGGEDLPPPPSLCVLSDRDDLCQREISLKAERQKASVRSEEQWRSFMIHHLMM